MINLINDIKFPTIYDNDFRLATFKPISNNVFNINYVIVIYKNINENDTIPLRIHSECKTGESFKSLRCDCNEQLENMLKFINSMNKGMIIYLPQEGRGIGILDKIKAYDQQDKYNCDTFQANKNLNLEIDYRKYDICNEILIFFKIKNVVLFTNNKSKFKTIKEKYPMTKRIGTLSTYNDYNKKYLDSKKNNENYIY